MASRSLPPDTPGQGDPSCVVELVGPGRLGEECSSYSMFVGKVEAYLRLARIPFKVTMSKGPLRGPKGKQPYIIHGKNTVGDSELIIAYLKAVYPDLTSRVPSMETGPPLATAAAARKVAEDSLYFHLLFFRWLTPAGWRGMQPLFASAGVWAPMVGGVMRSAVQKNLHGQGTSRHSPADIMRLAKADIDILAGLLGGQPFYGGAAPSQDDCAVFSCLDQLLYGMRAGAEDAAAYVERQPTLCAYTDRMRRLLFPHVVEGRQLADGTQFPMALAQQPLASL